MFVTWLIFFVALLFAVIGLVCVLSIVVGLPGTWLMIALAVLIELFDGLWRPEGFTQTFPWWVFVVAIALAVLGEILEFLASALGAKTGGASRRGMIGSLIGAFVGGIVGTFVFIFIPLLGSILGASIGAAIGAVAGELRDPNKRLRDMIRPASGAALGRLLGTIGKLPCGVAAWIALVVAAFWP